MADPDYSKITQEQFDDTLSAIMDQHTGAALLAITGAYEVFSEHFNNEVLEVALEKFHPERLED